MATTRRALREPNDPATVPAWVLTFAAAEEHWMSLVDPAEEPPGYVPIRNSWAYWEAERIYREVSAAWLQEHAPDVDLYAQWNEIRRRSGHPQIHGRAARQMHSRHPRPPRPLADGEDTTRSTGAQAPPDNPPGD